jgi:hypothetical protein
MTNANRELSSLRDAKYYLALRKSSPDAELLDELVRSFPQHAEELTEFAIDLALDSIGESHERGLVTSEQTSPAVSRAISRFHNRLYLEKKGDDSSAAPISSPNNPFESMGREELRTVARNINVNLPFVMKLRDRQIHADTIPDGFTERVSKQLDVPVDLLVAHFQAPPEIRTAARFKADEKPEANLKQSFKEAVRNSALTSEQQESLLNL